MPLKSKAQGRLLNARFGHDWVKKHHFGGSQKGLPEKLKGGTENVGLSMYKAMQRKKK